MKIPIKPDLHLDASDRLSLDLGPGNKVRRMRDRSKMRWWQRALKWLIYDRRRG